MNQNCAELLFKANREIKSLNYRLMRVITTDENCHTLLLPGRVNDLEVIEQTAIVCKVPVKGMPSPLKFAVKTSAPSGELRSKTVSKAEKKPDLKVYLSSHHKEPSDQHSEKTVINVSRE